MPHGEWIHPCQKCGACCAKWRVVFYWREAEPPLPGWSPADQSPSEERPPVPRRFTEDCGQWIRCMKGTDSKHQLRCEALTGRIGDQVACSIYDRRPSPCRAFEASFEGGRHQPRCDEARAAHGLSPLRRQDWVTQGRQYPASNSAGVSKSAHKCPPTG